MEIIGINDIEKLILLGDEVLDQVVFYIFRYDDNGYPICIKYGQSKEERQKAIDLVMEQMKNRELSELVYRIIRDKNYSLTDALDYTAEYLLKLVDSIKKRIIGIFRNAHLSFDTNYSVDNTVTDEYLLQLFAMRLRDRMIVFSSQR